jgi:hypothetical protein
VDAVQRRPLARREQLGNALVSEDHQLLDEHVRVRLALPASVGDAALPVELECELEALDAQRAPRETPFAQEPGESLGVGQRLGELGLRRLSAREDLLDAPVREALAAADHGAIEHRLALRQLGAVKRHLDRHA